MNKTKPTDFAKTMAKYLFNYLPEQRGVSANTIQSYSDCLSIFLEFCEGELHISRAKLEIDNISCAVIEQFYHWLEQVKGNSLSTRNQRRMAMNAFFKYLQYENPGYVLLGQQIRSIPKKVDRRQTIEHLSVSAVGSILQQPNLKTRNGRRDFSLLSLMYETAARVSEIANLCVADIRFERDGATVHLLGKGRKHREVPIIQNVAGFLRGYLAEERQNRPCQKGDPLFCNRTKDFLTRAGIAYILDKHVETARSSSDELSQIHVYPHIFRHSRAMHWLEAGIDLQYIKDLLGHADISTTEVYARLSVDMKRKLLENVHPVDHASPQYPSWSEDKNLLEWLRSFQ